jgi:hypothetical protein
MSQPTARRFEMALPNRIIQVEENYFKSDFNHSSFMFSHNLANHPLFELSTLAEIAEVMLSSEYKDNFSCFNNDRLSESSRLDELQPRERVSDAILNLKNSNFWIKLTRINAVIPEFDHLLTQIIYELEALTNIPLIEEITWSAATVFMTSPNLVTPYHIDPEANFLLQIRGEKDVYLFDQADRSILSEEEIEQFYIGNGQPAKYRKEKQDEAHKYHLVPGKGIHHPIHAPHWVKNANDFSISLSIGFCVRSFDLKARIYQVNHYLRKLGLIPTPPDKSRWKDNSKILLMGMLSKREPKDHHEAVFSGVERIKAPAKLVRELLRKN